MVYDRAVVVRKQVTVTPEVDSLIRRLARERGMSQSRLIAEAVLALPSTAGQTDRMLALAGAIDTDQAQLSEEVDRSLYGG